MAGVEDTGEEEGMKMLPTDSTSCQEPTEGLFQNSLGKGCG